MLPTIIDFEASGFGFESYPIEVGVALSSGERFCTLISPCEQWSHWSEDAALVHRIKRDDLTRRGLSVVDVCLRLNQLLRGQTVYSDGWVVDKPWFNKLFEAAKIEATFTLSPIESIQSQAQQQMWADVKAELLEQNSYERHRASHDALLIQEVYKATRQLTYT